MVVAVVWLLLGLSVLLLLLFATLLWLFDSLVSLSFVRSTWPSCSRFFQGHFNPALPIRASVSEDGRFAMCGSEDGLVHVWDSGPHAPWAGEC